VKTQGRRLRLQGIAHCFFWLRFSAFAARFSMRLFAGFFLVSFLRSLSLLIESPAAARISPLLGTHSLDSVRPGRPAASAISRLLRQVLARQTDGKLAPLPGAGTNHRYFPPVQLHEFAYQG
jgi:hypothetical protein